MGSLDRLRLRLISEGRPYVRLGWHRSGEAATRIADALLEGGYRPAEGGAPIPATAPFPWERVGELGSSFELIEPLLEAHAATGRGAYLAAAVDLALDFDQQAAAEGRPGVVGERAYRLAALAAAGADPVVGDDRLLGLIAMAKRHVELLTAAGGGDWDDRVRRALGLLGLATRLGRVLPARRTRRRALRLLGRELGLLGEEGVAPGMTPGDLARAAEVIAAVDGSGLADIGDLRARVEETLAWLILPDGALVNFGDTADETLSGDWGPRSGGGGLLTERFVSKALIHVLSCGRWGESPGTRRVFAGAGFAVIRRDGESHLALSRDEALAVTWFDRGRRILIGPGGRVAEADPSAVVPPNVAAGYLRSVRARNTVEIVGTTEAPGGTVGVSVGGGVPPTVTAQAERGGVRHRRRLTAVPGSWLLVVDELEASEPHVYRQWFHAAGGLDVVVRNGGVILADQGEPFAWFAPAGAGIPLTPVRAVPMPCPAGWWSPRGRSLSPRWSFGWELEGRSATMAVLISLKGRPELDDRGGRPAWRVGDHRIPVPAAPEPAAAGARR